MNQWDRFNWVMTEGLSAVDVAIGLNELLEYLKGSTEGSEAERQGLKAAATAVLAEGGFASLQQATAEAQKALALGVEGSPGWYLAIAAAENSDADLILDALATIPENYFDDQGAHWRSVVLLELEAQARCQKGARGRVGELVGRLNGEYKKDYDDGTFYIPRPRKLAEMLYANRSWWPMLAQLFSGLDLEWWVDAERLQDYAGVLRELGEPSWDALNTPSERG